MMSAITEIKENGNIFSVVCVWKRNHL